MAAATGLQQRNIPLREKNAQPASVLPYAEPAHQEEADDPEDLDYRYPPEGFDSQGSMSKSRKRIRRKFRNHDSRKSRRLTYTVDDEVIEAASRVTVTARVGKASAVMTEHVIQEQSRGTPDGKDFSRFPAATLPPATKFSSGKRKLLGATTERNEILTPVQVVLFNPDPDTPFIVLGTYSIVAITPREIGEKARNHVGFAGSYSDPKDHVDGQILIRDHSKDTARWEVVESSQLHDYKSRRPNEINHGSSSGALAQRVQIKVRCLLHLESDTRSVQEALEEGKMEAV